MNALKTLVIACGLALALGAVTPAEARDCHRHHHHHGYYGYYGYYPRYYSYSWPWSNYGYPRYSYAHRYGHSFAFGGHHWQHHHHHHHHW